MKKTYLTERQIAELVKEGNSILTQSDFSKLHSIGKKYGIELIFGKQANVELWYNKIKELLSVEPRNGKFILATERNHYPGFASSTNPECVKEYIKYLNIWDSEYVFLCSKKWDDLQTFATYHCGGFGIDTFGGATIYIKNGGDYYGHISKHGKKFCDPEALKRSTELKKTIDSLFKGMEAPEKMHIANIIMQYASTIDMNADDFHNALFAGQ